MALHPRTGEVWVHEHGLRGGAESAAGRPNYGWPVITYGVEYGIGTQMGRYPQARHGPAELLLGSFDCPFRHEFYNGDRFPQWRGSLFIGSLKFRLLTRLGFTDGEVVKRTTAARNSWTHT